MGNARRGLRAARRAGPGTCHDGSGRARPGRRLSNVPAALAAAAALGPHLGWEVHPAGGARPDGWLSGAELLAPHGPLHLRTLTVREVLAGGRPVEDVPLAAAASVSHLAVVGRLLGPAVAVTILAGGTPDLALDDVWWQPTLGGPLPLSVALRPGGSLPALLDGPIAAVTRAVGPLPELVTSGNVASVVVGTARAVAAAHPSLAAAAHLLTAELLALPGVDAGNGRFDGYRRRGCCLIHQASPGRAEGVCGDCVLLDAPSRRQGRLRSR